MVTTREACGKEELKGRKWEMGIGNWEKRSTRSESWLIVSGWVGGVAD